MDVSKLSKNAKKIISECFGRLYIYFDRKCPHGRCDPTLVVKKPAIGSFNVIGEKQDLIDLKKSLNACSCECIKK